MRYSSKTVASLLEPLNKKETFTCRKLNSKLSWFTIKSQSRKFFPMNLLQQDHNFY